jgi:hypothetical protein
MPRVLLKVMNIRDPMLYSAATAVEAGALGLYVIKNDIFRIGQSDMVRTALASAGFWAYGMAVDAMPYSHSGSAGVHKAVIQTANSTPTKAVAKAATAALATGAYAQFVMQRNITNPRVLQFMGVVFASSLATGMVYDRVHTGLESPGLGLGLTPESGLQAISTAGLSSLVYEPAFGSTPNVRALSFIAGADLVGLALGPFMAKLISGQTV